MIGEKRKLFFSFLQFAEGLATLQGGNAFAL